MASVLPFKIWQRKALIAALLAYAEAVRAVTETTVCRECVLHATPSRRRRCHRYGRGGVEPKRGRNCMAAEGATPRVGAAYNVFDGEELLEASIKSIQCVQHAAAQWLVRQVLPRRHRGVVSFVCVVYQEVSNFGHKNPVGAVRYCEGTLRFLTPLHCAGPAGAAVGAGGGGAGAGAAAVHASGV